MQYRWGSGEDIELLTDADSRLEAAAHNKRMSASTTDDQPSPALLELYAEMERQKLFPYWVKSGGLLSQNPMSRGKPSHWPGTELCALVEKAQRLVSYATAGDRRAIGLSNPSLEGSVGTTHTILAALQILMPSEVASAHRHTHTAIRLILDGELSTTIQGSTLRAGKRDVLVTPSMLWHDLWNESTKPVTWLDGTDIPLVLLMLGTVQQFFEPGAHPRLPVVENPANRPLTVGMLRPVRANEGAGCPTVYVYPWDAIRIALDDLQSGPSDPFDDVALDLVEPSGGPVTPTLGVRMQLLRPGAETRAHRHVASTVYSVLEGSGETTIGDTVLRWAEGDVFTVPSWCRHSHANRSTTPALLYSVHDAPAMRALGIYRDEP